MEDDAERRARPAILPEMIRMPGSGRQRIATSTPGGRAGLIGAVSLVTEELFTPAGLARWLDKGSPVGMAELASS